jgi:hypothetical protein
MLFIAEVKVTKTEPKEKGPEKIYTEIIPVEGHNEEEVELILEKYYYGKNKPGEVYYRHTPTSINVVLTRDNVRTMNHK